MISIDIGKCTGCGTCATICSFYHSGAISRRLSRIKVEHIYSTGIDGPVVCVQCEERYCMDCPAGAIQMGKNGQIVVTPTLCLLCGKCESSCPIGAIEIFNGIVYVCDLCGGSPRCVDVCTEDAISYIPDLKDQISLGKLKNETEKMNVSERRVHYIRKLGEKLRTEWGK